MGNIGEASFEAMSSRRSNASPSGSVEAESGEPCVATGIDRNKVAVKKAAIRRPERRSIKFANICFKLAS